LSLAIFCGHAVPIRSDIKKHFRLPGPGSEQTSDLDDQKRNRAKAPERISPCPPHLRVKVHFLVNQKTNFYVSFFKDGIYLLLHWIGWKAIF